MQQIKTVVCKYKTVCQGILGFLISVALWLMLGIVRSREFLLAGLLMMSVYIVLYFGSKYANARRAKFALILAIPFGACFELGQIITPNNTDIGFKGLIDVYIFIMLSIFFVFLNICVMHFVDKYRVLTEQNIKKESKKHTWLVYSLIMFACWFVMFLIFFPGLISVDSAVQIAQVVGERGLSNWHPVLHTLFLSVFIDIGNYVFGNLTAGIALSVIIQMLIIAAIYGYTIDWVIKRSGKKWIGILLLVFFSINHVVISYSITIWKDILFSSIFLLLILKVYDFIKDNGKNKQIEYKNIWLIILLSVLVAFLRNGGVLVVAALGLSLFIYYKKSRKKIALGFIGAVAFIMLVQGPIYTILGITGSPFVESISIPAQQIGYLASAGELTEDEKTKLSNYVDLEKIAIEYSPMSADNAKNCFDYDKVDKNKLDLLLIWLSMAPRHLDSFIKAYILHTYSYWYVQAENWTLGIQHEHNERWLSAEYQDIALLGEEARNYVIMAENLLTTLVFSGWMNNVGILCWWTLYMLVLFLYQRRYKMLIVMSCILIYILSLLIASPVPGVFRYVYTLLLSLPVLTVLLFCKNKMEEKK